MRGVGGIFFSITFAQVSLRNSIYFHFKTVGNSFIPIYSEIVIHKETVRLQIK